MNSPKQLFLKRIKLNVKFQYKVIRTVVDLVVALYFFVPALIAVIMYSRHLWNAQPSFLFQVPLIIVSLVMFILIASSSCRTFYEYGDQLFLIQQKKWYQAIKYYGVIYTLIVHAVKCLIIFGLILPLLYVGLNLSLLHIASFYLLTVVMMTSYSFIKRRISLMLKFINRVISYIGIFIIGLLLYSTVLTLSPIIQMTCSLLIMVALMRYATKQQASYATFFIQLANYDLVGRYTYLKLILTTGEYKIPAIKKTKAKPKLFKQSNPLFKVRSDVNILVENGIKQFIRNKDYMLMYIYFSLASCYALFFLPIEGKIVYVLAFSFIYLLIGKQIWRLFMDGDFMKLYKWEDIIKIKALQKGSLLFALPGYTLLFVVFLCLSPSLIMLLINIAIGLIAYSVLFGLSSFTVK